MLNTSTIHNEVVRVRTLWLHREIDLIIPDSAYFRQSMSTNDAIQPPAASAPERVGQILTAALTLYARKCLVYQTERAPMMALELPALAGVEAWKGTLIRMADKLVVALNYARLENLEHDETFQETLLDVICYAALTHILFDEHQDHDAILKTIQATVDELVQP